MPKPARSIGPDRRMLLKAGGTASLGFLLTGCLGIDFGSFTQIDLPEPGKPYSTAGAGDLINQLRRSRNLQPVARDPALQEAAVVQARLMARHGKMQHTTGPGTQFARRMKQVGYRRAAGENIASGHKTIEETMEAWMQSPPHRRILLEKRFAHYGIAVARDRKTDRPYWALVMGV